VTTAPVVVLPDGRLAYTLPEAATVVPFSAQTLTRAARKAKADDVFPHPLKAHRDSKGRVIVLATDLQAWLERLPDY
jgi:hypothetical protein